MPSPIPGFEEPGKPGFKLPSWPKRVPRWLPNFCKSEEQECADDCKDDCDKQNVRDLADCEWRYKMGGRTDGHGYGACIQIAQDDMFKCYKRCDDKCKKSGG